MCVATYVYGKSNEGALLVLNLTRMKLIDSKWTVLFTKRHSHSQTYIYDNQLVGSSHLFAQDVARSC